MEHIKNKNMSGKNKILLILILVLSINGLYAQNSEVSYFMNIPQNHLLNPSFRPSNRIYVNLPGISGVNINMNNNFVNFSDIFNKSRESDSLITFLHPEYNINDFLDKIKNKNFIEPEFMMPVLGFGFVAGKNYIYFDINARAEANFVIPGDLFRLAFKGNEQFAGESIDFSSLRGDMKLYREIGLGFSRDVTERLRIGIKAKLLSGIASSSVDNRSLEIKVGNDYSHTLDADLNVNFSGPVKVQLNSDNTIDSIWFDDDRFDGSDNVLDFIMGKKNSGFGIDLGASYRFNDKINLSASITDLGFIKWKKDLTNLRIRSNFAFSGIDMTDVIDGDKTFEEAGDEMLDSLKNSFKVTKSSDPFTTFLPFGVTLGGSYSVTRSFSLGILSYSRFIGKQMRESLTMSANLNLGSHLSTSISYTAANHRFDNIGAGLAFRAGILQFYMMSDRIPVTWNKIQTDDGGSSFMLPATWNNFNLRIGMNLVFGNRIKKKNDMPMLNS
jgi:hypothetical protein